MLPRQNKLNRFEENIQKLAYQINTAPIKTKNMNINKNDISCRSGLSCHGAITAVHRKKKTPEDKGPTI